FDILPFGEAMAAPGLFHRFQAAILVAPPFAEFSLRCPAVAVDAAYAAAAALVRNVGAGGCLSGVTPAAVGVGLVPQVVAVHSRVVAIPVGQSLEEGFGAGPHFGIVEAQTRKPARCAGSGITGGALKFILRFEARFGVLLEHPLRSSRDHFGQDGLNPILS